jgi:hypothetical protein
MHTPINALINKGVNCKEDRQSLVPEREKRENNTPVSAEAQEQTERVPWKNKNRPRPTSV